jgi:4-hydroxy-tetrahydrodipicolinate synthase
MVPAGVLGSKGVFSMLSGVAPRLVRRVYELYSAQKFVDARKPQEQIASLHHLVKTHGLAGLKEALRLMGRNCGQPRPPARSLAVNEQENLAAQWRGLPFLETEPHGW